MKNPLLYTLLLFSLLSCNTKVEGQTAASLKVIAPDLIVESIEFGTSPEHKTIFDLPADKVVFTPTTTAVHGDIFGYRLKLKTSRKTVKYSDLKDFVGKKMDEKTAPKGGLVYNQWAICECMPNGKHSLKIWVEGVQLPTFYYTVK